MVHNGENGSRTKSSKNKKAVDILPSPKIESSNKEETELAHINLKKTKKKERSQSSKVEDTPIAENRRVKGMAALA